MCEKRRDGREVTYLFFKNTIRCENSPQFLDMAEISNTILANLSAKTNWVRYVTDQKQQEVEFRS